MVRSLRGWHPCSTTPPLLASCVPRNQVACLQPSSPLIVSLPPPTALPHPFLIKLRRPTWDWFWKPRQLHAAGRQIAAADTRSYRGPPSYEGPPPYEGPPAYDLPRGGHGSSSSSMGAPPPHDPVETFLANFDHKLAQLRDFPDKVKQLLTWTTWFPWLLLCVGAGVVVVVAAAASTTATAAAPVWCWLLICWVQMAGGGGADFFIGLATPKDVESGNTTCDDTLRATIRCVALRCGARVGRRRKAAVGRSVSQSVRRAGAAPSPCFWHCQWLRVRHHDGLLPW